MLKRALLILPMTLLLTACSSLAPQQLTLTPAISINKPLPKTPALVLVEDKRSSPIIGYRVDRFENRAAITFDDTKPVIQTALNNALQRAGVTALGPGGYTLTASLDELTYTAAIKGLNQQVKLSTSLRLKIELDGKQYSGRYSSNLDKKIVSTPSPEDNQQLVNQLLEQTLNRAMNDPKLLRFIQFN